MEISKGNSLCSYLDFSLVKMSFFFFLSFVYFLLQNQRTGGRTGSAGGGISWGREKEGEIKGEGR
jgi:hypothetical protein